MRTVTECGISPGFPELSPTEGYVAHVLLTRSPLGHPLPYGRESLVRLACVRHAASVNPEPGSNSPSKRRPKALALSRYESQRVSHPSVVKVLVSGLRRARKARSRSGPKYSTARPACQTEPAESGAAEGRVYPVQDWSGGPC